MVSANLNTSSFRARKASDTIGGKRVTRKRKCASHFASDARLCADERVLHVHRALAARVSRQCHACRATTSKVKTVTEHHGYHDDHGDHDDRDQPGPPRRQLRPGRPREPRRPPKNNDDAGIQRVRVRKVSAYRRRIDPYRIGVYPKWHRLLHPPPCLPTKT